MPLYPDVEFTDKIKAYLNQYGRDQWDVVESGTLNGYDVIDCWDLAYDALLQNKKLTFYFEDEAMTRLRYRYILA